MMLAEMPRDESAWARALDVVTIPVLRRTIEELARLREHEERVIARDIARVLLHDPMFSLRVLRYLQVHRSTAQTTDITTVEHALMMLGIAPFFSHFGDMPAVESALAGQPRALDGLMRVVNRAHHAALYAQDWAAARHDRSASEVAIAALLHDLTEMLLWCFAPETSLRIADMLRVDGTLRSSAAQSKVLGFKLAGLQSALIEQWKLPALLQSLMDDEHATQPRVMNVALAVNLARHSARGWSDPALPDDYAAIQRFLKLPRPELLARIGRVALQAQTAHDWYHLNVEPVPADLENVPRGVQDCANSDDSQLAHGPNSGQWPT